MSQKRVKQIRKKARQATRRIEADMVDRLLEMSWKDRVAAAWIIVKGKR